MTVYASPYREFVEKRSLIPKGMCGAKMRRINGVVIVLDVGENAPSGYDYVTARTTPVPAGEKISLGPLPAGAVVYSVTIAADSGGAFDVGDNLDQDRFHAATPADGAIHEMNKPFTGYLYRSADQTCLYAVPAAELNGIFLFSVEYATE